MSSVVSVVKELPRQHDFLWLGAALLFAFLAFSNTLANDFVFDDHFLIVNNQPLRDSRYLSRIFNPAPEDNPVMESPSAQAGFVAYYRPFTRALFALIYRVFGLDTKGWHAVNLGLYLVVVALAFLLLRNLVPREDLYGPATLLFALHPIHSEVVSWANCLVETLHATFFLAAFLLFICWRRSERRWRAVWLAASIIAAMGAILSKETAISLPLLIAGYMFFVDQRAQNWRARFRSVLLVTVPYLGVIALYLLLRYRAGGGNLQVGAAGRIDLTLRTLPAVLIKYLSLLLLPINLSPAYPSRPVGTFASAQFLMPAAILVVLVAIVARYYFSNSVMRCGWLLLLVPLAPVLNVGMLLPELIVQDRYLFLPSLGFCLLGGVLFASLPKQGPLPRRALLLLLLVCYGTLAIRQNSYWRNDRELFAHALTVDPKSSFAHINLAGAYAEAGEMGAAEQEYTQALRYNPDCAICFANIADINYARGNRKQAVAFYREALRYGYRDTAVLHAFAVGSMEVGETEQAIAAFEQVAALEPKSASAQANVGQAYLMTGDNARAIQWLERAIALEPGNAERHFLLAVACERANQRERAIEEYRRTLSIKPDHREANESLKRLEEGNK